MALSLLVVFLPSELSKVKVIDMTQREQRVYEGYAEALSRSSRYSRRADDADEDAVDAEAKKRERRIEGHFFEVPVLCHNIDLIIKTTEDDIRRLDRGARYEEDRAAGLHHEIERLSKVSSLLYSIYGDFLQIRVDILLLASRLTLKSYQVWPCTRR